MKDLQVYINGIFFEHLANSRHFGDRVEFYREHERKLWTINQILLNGNNNLVITDRAKQPEFETSNSEDFKKWVRTNYPDFVEQLNELEFTKYAHPNDHLGT